MPETRGSLLNRRMWADWGRIGYCTGRRMRQTADQGWDCYLGRGMEISKVVCLNSGGLRKEIFLSNRGGPWCAYIVECSWEL